MTPTARTPNVFMAGGGRVAGALAGALRRAGVPVLGMWGRRPERLREAGAIAGVATFAPTPPDLLLEADCVIVAVTDEALPQVARMLVDTGLITRRHVFLQCSGAQPAREVFGEVADRLGGIGTLHPLRSIVDARQAMMTMKGTVFGVEGDEAGRALAAELVGLLGGRALDLGPEMGLYHAAASMASNFLVALVDAAVEALQAAGVSRAEALTALLPLVRGTVENLGAIEDGAAGKALTGPILRGDAATVERHLEALKKRAPALLPLYRAAGRRAAAIARSRGEAKENALAEIDRLLEGGREDR
jgi:predicted short-subunit dehydrogenase-like oxidoreductase (DUF2520 family)